MRIDFMVTLACPPKQALATPGLLPLLRANDARVQPFAPHCRSCPASMNGTSFSCWGVIGFPFREQTEEWIVEQVQDEGLGVDSLATMLKRYDGAPVHQLRASGAFERREVHEIVCGGEDEEETVELEFDRILHAMFFSGPLPPSALMIFSLALQLIPPDAPDALIRAALIDVTARRRLLSLVRGPVDAPTPQTMAVQLFFGAMLRALSLDLPLVVEAM